MTVAMVHDSRASSPMMTCQSRRRSGAAGGIGMTLCLSWSPSLGAAGLMMAGAQGVQRRSIDLANDGATIAIWQISTLLLEGGAEIPERNLSAAQ